MRRKIGTLLDENILRQAKRLSVTRQIPLNQLIEEALEKYLEWESGEELLTLEEALTAEPASRAGEGKGRGSGDIDEDLD
jgi:hypothetical protein